MTHSPSNHIQLQDAASTRPWTHNKYWSLDVSYVIGYGTMAVAAIGSFYLTGMAVHHFNEGNADHLAVATREYNNRAAQEEAYLGEQSDDCAKLLRAYRDDLIIKTDQTVWDVHRSGICGPSGLAIAKTAANNAVSAKNAQTTLAEARKAIHSDRKDLFFKLAGGAIGGFLLGKATGFGAYIALDSYVEKQKSKVPYMTGAIVSEYKQTK